MLSSSRKVSACLSSSGTTAARINVRLLWRKTASPMASAVLAAQAMSTLWSTVAISRAISAAHAAIRKLSPPARSCRPPCRQTSAKQALTLTTWCQAFYLIGQAKTGSPPSISTASEHDRAGGCLRAAGKDQVDHVYLGGELTRGKSGRGSEH